MNKSELIEIISGDNNLSKAAAGRVLDTVITSIVNAVSKMDDVKLIGFGSFKATKRAARLGKNPRSGEPVKIAAATIPKFVAGVAFKAAVNRKTSMAKRS